MKYLLIGFLAFCVCSCSFIRSVTKKRTSDTHTSDSVATSKSQESNSVKKDSSTGESGSKSSKSNFQFVIDTNRKAPVVNNYITPASTGNQGFDFMRWLAANGYLKSGSINLQDDSTYQRYNRLMLDNLALKQKNDSLASHTSTASESDSKSTTKTIEWHWWQIILLGLALLGVWEGLRWVKSSFKIIRI